MLEVFIAVVAVISAIAALIGAGIAVLRYRARPQHLPVIEMYGTEGFYWVRLVTDHNSIGWKIMGVQVDEAEPRACLDREVFVQVSDDRRDFGPTGEWREYCDYSDVTDPRLREMLSLMIHPDCYKALLSFICEVPKASRLWWKPWTKSNEKRVPYEFRIGEQQPFHAHPFWQ